MILADASSTWSPGPLYLAAQPYILAIIGAAMTVIFGYATSYLQAHFNLSLDASLRDKVQTAALNAAGRIMASQDDKFAAMKVDVHSELIEQEIPVVMSLVGGAVQQLGLTPDKLKALILAKLGMLQAQAQGASKVVS